MQSDTLDSHIVEQNSVFSLDKNMLVCRHKSSKQETPHSTHLAETDSMLLKS